MTIRESGPETNAVDGDAAGAPEFPQANIVAARAIARALETTYGPLGLDKLVVGEDADESPPGVPTVGQYAVTGDGARILERLPLEHPIAPMIERLVGPERPGDSDVEGQDIPDGVVTRTLLAASLLDEADGLLDRGIHPQTIVRGYEHARTAASERLLADRRRFATFDDERAARVATARTAMAGNDVGGQADRWAEMAVDAVDLVGMPDELSFAVRRTRRGRIADSKLVRGAVLDRSQRVRDEMPRRVEDAAVLVVDGHDRGGLVERDAPDGAVIDPGDGVELADFETARRDRKRRVVDAFTEAGVDVVVTRLGIDADYQRLLADEGILGVRGVTSLELRRLAAATGAEAVCDPTDVGPDVLGTVGEAYEEAVEARDGQRRRRTMVVFDDCPDPESVAVVCYGATGELSEQVTIQVRKAAHAVAVADGVARHPAGVVAGGGGCHCRVAAGVRSASSNVDSREAMAMDAYADAARSLLARLARNAGLDPLAVVPDVRAAQAEWTEAAGLVLPSGEVVDCFEGGVLDPAGVVIDAYDTATAVAKLVLCIDDAVDATFAHDPTDSDDVIYDDAAERQQRELERREDG